MHEAWDNRNALVCREIVQALTHEEMSGKLQALHGRDMNNPNISRITQTKVGRNQPCPCGSGVKFKKCCLSLAQNRGEVL